MRNKSNDSSRRNFLKSGSVFLLGNVVFSDPISKLLAESFSLKVNSSAFDFTCELFRGIDLLYLKYFFFNARINGNQIKRIGTEPLYIYIKIPSQHIGEEMLTKDADRFSSFTEFEIQKSYLAKSSWLAFKLTDKLKSVQFNPESLLNWKDNFDLLTIDDFAKREEKAHYSSYKAAITALKNGFMNQTLSDEPVLHATGDSGNPLQPITTFEVPYKMWISPIATPIENDQSDSGYFRALGEHIFKDDNDVKIHYHGNVNEELVEIVSPWQNSLVFKDLTNRISQPRFKVVRAICQDPTIGERNLLPAPINREELKELTMRPEYDRDVRSEFFKISSFGASTYLKYKNDDPDKFSLVAWEQKIKYARDNYVSVTFRAIDVFTGLKLLISIVAERRFKHGISYLQKKYHVAYAENEKTYADDVVISRVPFKKIIPKTAGAFFYPQMFGTADTEATKPTDDSYLVAKYRPSTTSPLDPLNIFDNNGDIVDENLLEFDYTGIDKSGVEHQFKSKIIFIPAERYVIEPGPAFNFIDENGNPQSIAPGNSVKIQDIGELNPGRDIRMSGKVYSGCIPSPTDTYKFKVEKVFSITTAPTDGRPSKLQKLIKALSEILNKEKYRASFGIQMKSELCYAKIEELKNLGHIRADSANTTFQTKNILFVPEYNSKINGADFYADNFPLIPVLQNADIIISQIDQIQGRSEYHRVKYFEGYRSSLKDLDEPADNS